MLNTAVHTLTQSADWQFHQIPASCLTTAWSIAVYLSSWPVCTLYIVFVCAAYIYWQRGIAHTAGSLLTKIGEWQFHEISVCWHTRGWCSVVYKLSLVYYIFILFSFALHLSCYYSEADSITLVITFACC